MAEAQPIQDELAPKESESMPSGTKVTQGSNTTPPTASQDGVLPGHNGLSSPRP